MIEVRPDESENSVKMFPVSAASDPFSCCGFRSALLLHRKLCDKLYFSVMAADGNGSFVSRNNRPGNGKAQPIVPVLSGPGLIGPVKPFKQVLLLFRRNLFSIVHYRQKGVAFFLSEGNAHFISPAAVPDCIID